jgi:hypothetical protein
MTAWEISSFAAGVTASFSLEQETANTEAAHRAAADSRFLIFIDGLVSWLGGEKIDECAQLSIKNY